MLTSTENYRARGIIAIESYCMDGARGGGFICKMDKDGCISVSSMYNSDTQLLEKDKVAALEAIYTSNKNYKFKPVCLEEVFTYVPTATYGQVSMSTFASYKGYRLLCITYKQQMVIACYDYKTQELIYQDKDTAIIEDAVNEIIRSLGNCSDFKELPTVIEKATADMIVQSLRRYCDNSTLLLIMTDLRT